MTAEAAAPKTKKTTEYVVLRDDLAEASSGPNPTGSSSAPARLTVVKTVKAKSANDAIRQAAGKNEGAYYAVPARSFKPVKVTVHTETTVRLG